MKTKKRKTRNNSRSKRGGRGITRKTRNNSRTKRGGRAITRKINRKNIRRTNRTKYSRKRTKKRLIRNGGMRGQSPPVSPVPSPPTRRWTEEDYKKAALLIEKDRLVQLLQSKFSKGKACRNIAPNHRRICKLTGKPLCKWDASEQRCRKNKDIIQKIKDLSKLSPDDQRNVTLIDEINGVDAERTEFDMDSGEE